MTRLRLPILTFLPLAISSSLQRVRPVAVRLPARGMQTFERGRRAVEFTNGVTPRECEQTIGIEVGSEGEGRGSWK
eukprot:899928-Amorphochlora_amoeboformis.AAC.1